MIFSIAESRVDDSGVIYVGCSVEEAGLYTGLLQDLRLYNRKLTPV